MENTIVTIIKELINKDLIDNAYDNRLDTIQFNCDKKLNANMKVIIDFNNTYFKNFEYTLLINSIIYALEIKDNTFLDFILKNINNIKIIIKQNEIFRIKISEYAIKNIINNLDENMVFKNELNTNIINKNKKLFNSIRKKYIIYKGVGNIYRDLILNLIYKYPDIVKDDMLFLEEFLFTNKFDVFFIIHNKEFINQNNIKEYKKILIRLILGDNYINSEVELFEDDLDEYLSDLDDEFKYNEDDEESLEISLDIIEYLNECIKNNNFILPKDNDLRFNMYRKFLIYNSGDFDKSYDYDTINSDNEKKLKLSKINPLSKIDFI